MDAILGLLTSRTLMLCMSIYLVVIIYWWLKFQKQLRINLLTATVLGVFQVVSSIVIMRLWSIVETGGITTQTATMRLFGVLFLAPPIYLLWAKLTKRNIALAMDVSIMCLVMELIPGRANCLMHDCCKAFPLFEGNSFRLPIREAEIVYAVVMMIIFWRRIVRGKTHGEVLPIVFISYGALRFCAEWFREEFTGSIGIFHLAHIWSLLSIAAGLVILYFVRKSNAAGEKRTNPHRHAPQGGK